MNVYTKTNAILAPSDARATADAIEAWWDAHGPAAAAAFAPDKTYRPVPRALFDALVAQHGPADLVGCAGQLAEDSAYGQSAIARDKGNYAGLGAEDNAPYQGAHIFATPADFINAYVGHLFDYAIGVGEWSRFDGRLKNMPVAWIGKARVWDDLTGKWATDPTYGEDVASHASSFLAFLDSWAGGTPVVDISGYVPPRITQQWFPVNGVSYLGEDMQMRGVCVPSSFSTAISLILSSVKV